MALLDDTKGLSILIVDDEMEITELFTKIFNNAGYKNVVIVESGQKALAVVKEQSFDIVFLDMLLPDMNGDVIFEELKSMVPDVPVVFISGKVGLNEEEINEKGAYGFIKKPFDLEDIFKILNKLARSKD